MAMSKTMRMAVMRDKSDRDRERERWERERPYPTREDMPMATAYTEPPYMGRGYMPMYEGGRYPMRSAYDAPPYDGRRMGYENQKMHYGREPEEAEEYPRHKQGRRMDAYSAQAEVEPLTMEQATAWVENMEGSDPAKPRGGKWSPDEVKAYAKKVGILPSGTQFAEFYAAMNAMYSDYAEVAKKYGVSSPDFYADLAKAFVCDKDAKPDKAARYYKFIVGN